MRARNRVELPIFFALKLRTVNLPSIQVALNQNSQIQCAPLHFRFGVMPVEYESRMSISVSSVGMVISTGGDLIAAPRHYCLGPAGSRVSGRRFDHPTRNVVLPYSQSVSSCDWFVAWVLCSRGHAKACGCPARAAATARRRQRHKHARQSAIRGQFANSVAAAGGHRRAHESTSQSGPHSAQRVSSEWDAYTAERFASRECVSAWGRRPECEPSRSERHQPALAEDA